MCLPPWTDLLAEVGRRPRTHSLPLLWLSRSRAAENALRDELKRKADGLAASPDPRHTLVDDLLTALKDRYRVEGRRSLERLGGRCRAPAPDVPRPGGGPCERLRRAALCESAPDGKSQARHDHRELAALRAGYGLGLDNDTIVAMPRTRLLPENNAPQGFADIKQVTAICRHLSPDLADAVQFMFITVGGAAPRCSRFAGRTWTSQEASYG